MLKKALSILLAVFILTAALSLTAFADDGEEEKPITEIRTIEDLYMVNLDLGGSYKLMNDIDLTDATAAGGDWDYAGNGWEPIGSDGIYSASTPFRGTFDGNGFEIKGLRIELKRLPSGTGNAVIGLFAKNSGVIKNLTVSGSVSSNVTGSCIGAIVGNNEGTIEYCANKANVTITNANYTGGIAGYTSGTISKCCNTGNITGGTWAGGISNYGIISDCYNTGNVSTDWYSGGISGYERGKITNCYNIGTAKRAISYDSNTVTNCYYLSGSGSDVAGAKSLTAAQMKLRGVYKGFDFDNTWFIDEGSNYPYPQLIDSTAVQPVEPTENETEIPTETATVKPTEERVFYLGDVDGDGNTTVLDATFIQRFAAFMDVPYAIGEPI